MQNNKKSLPCKTHIMCGFCPFYERCHYIHDIRVESNNNDIFHLRKKNEEETVFDIWKWPEMEKNGNPNYYIMSKPNDNCIMINDSLYSIWNHFVINMMNYHTNPYDTYNLFINKIRLPIFIKLSSS